MKMCYICGLEPRSGKSSYCKEHLKSYYKEYNLINKSTKKSSVAKTLEQNAAYVAVHRAIINKKLFKPTRCPICNSKHDKVIAHHVNGYDKANQLNVEWMCQSCHVSKHKAMITTS